MPMPSKTTTAQLVEKGFIVNRDEASKFTQISHRDAFRIFSPHAVLNPLDLPECLKDSKWNPTENKYFVIMAGLFTEDEPLPFIFVDDSTASSFDSYLSSINAIEDLGNQIQLMETKRNQQLVSLGRAFSNMIA